MAIGYPDERHARESTSFRTDALNQQHMEPQRWSWALFRLDTRRCGKTRSRYNDRRPSVRLQGLDRALPETTPQYPIPSAAAHTLVFPRCHDYQVDIALFNCAQQAGIYVSIQDHPRMF